MHLSWCRLAALFFNEINMASTVYLEGHLRNISTKLSCNRTSRLWRKRILKFGYFSHFLMPQQPKFSMEFKSLNSFERRPPKEHSCDVWWKLFLRFRRRWCLKLKVNDGRRTQSDQNSSPWAFGSRWSKNGQTIEMRV